MENGRIGTPEEPLRYCICRQPYDAEVNGDMVCCDSGSCAIGWYHVSCLFLDVAQVRRADRFVCRFCSGSGRDVFGSAAAARGSTGRRRGHAAAASVTDYASLDDGDVGGAFREAVAVDALPTAAAVAVAEARAKATNGAALGLTVSDTGDAWHSIPAAPSVARTAKALDMNVPAEAYDPMRVATEYGLGVLCEALDVASQQELQPPWTLGQWMDYFRTPAERRQRVLNLISLEVSHTPTGRQFRAPRLIRDADWSRWCTRRRPKVGTYYLMSACGAWTSWHIDFGGSTVFYHLLRGHKVFYVAPPSTHNLHLYERWQSDPQQVVREPEFVTQLKAVARLELLAGNTLIIPHGWLHAVFTPEDSVVIGGNILHLRGFRMQQRIYELERRLRVPDKYQYPLFKELSWLAARHYTTRLAAARQAGTDVQQVWDAVERRELRELARVLRAYVQMWRKQVTPHAAADRLRSALTGMPPRVSTERCLQWVEALEGVPEI